MEQISEESTTDVSKASAIVRYDGPVLSEHSMDISDLAPALMGLSEIVKIANRQFNGDRTEVVVLVNVDKEQNCFQFNIEINQNLSQQMHAFFTNIHVSNAKEILQWIGIVVTLAGGASGVIGLYKWIARQRRPIDALTVEEGGTNVIISNQTNNDSIVVNGNAYLLARDPNTLKNLKQVVNPLTKNGYEVLQFEGDNGAVEQISSDEGRQIHSLNSDSLEFRPRVNITTSRAKLKVRKAIFEGSARWELVHDRTIEVKIEDVLWLERYQGGLVTLTPGSFLDVELRTEIELDGNDNPTGRVSYFITEVKEVIPPDQPGLFDPHPPSD